MLVVSRDEGYTTDEEARLCMHSIFIFASVFVAAFAYTADTVKFSTSSPNGLSWPLPDSKDLVSILIHAVHCKHMVQLNHSNTEMGKMHVTHCGKVQRMIEEQVEPDISVSLCRTIFGIASEYYAYRAQLGSYSYYADDELHQVNRGQVLSNPTEALAHLAGYNYGTLLMKEWEAPQTLTKSESEYLDSWFSPVVLKQSAIAYKCQRHGVRIYELSDERTGKHTGTYDVQGGPHE